MSRTTLDFCRGRRENALIGAHNYNQVELYVERDRDMNSSRAKRVPSAISISEPYQTPPFHLVVLFFSQTRYCIGTLKNSSLNDRSTVFHTHDPNNYYPACWYANVTWFSTIGFVENCMELAFEILSHL